MLRCVAGNGWVYLMGLLTIRASMMDSSAHTCVPTLEGIFGILQPCSNSVVTALQYLRLAAMHFCERK